MRDLGYDENNKEPILKGIMELIVKYVFILVMYNYMHLNIFTVINIVFISRMIYVGFNDNAEYVLLICLHNCG